MGEYTILGASGEYSDFQSTSVMLDELMYAPYPFLPTAAHTAAGEDHTHTRARYEHNHKWMMLNHDVAV